jgi:mannose-1-phosphate guanylyltransferase/mannose-6-phosphate isomerase
MEEVRTFAPEAYSAFETSGSLPEAFSKLDTKISVDYAILEKSARVAVVPADVGWNDLGSFDSFREILEADLDGNILPDGAIALGASDNLIYADGDKAVAARRRRSHRRDNRDALHICKKDESQRVPRGRRRDEKKGRPPPRIPSRTKAWAIQGAEEERGAFKISA